MSAAYKPEGHSTVSPYLIVAGASGTIDFLVKAFGARQGLRIPGPEGRIMHAEVHIDDSVVMLSDGMAGWPPQPAHVHVYVKDVDATYKKALEAGATSVQAPVK